MPNWTGVGVPLCLILSFSGCSVLDDLTELEVINQNNPDMVRVWDTAADAEALISSGFYVWHVGVYGSSNSVNTLSNAGEEGSVAWCGGSWAGYEPRSAWPNGASWRYASVNRNPWYRNYEALSSVYDGLAIIEAKPEYCADIDCDRAHAFAKFIQGLAHGFLGLMYDSAFVFDETVDLDGGHLKLKPYPNVIAAAEGYFEAAIDESAGASWTLPAGWIRGNPFSAEQLAKFAHSHTARMLYSTAREPREHAAADWQKIVDHVDAGIDLTMTRDGGYGREGIYLDGDPQQNWWQSLNYYGNATTASSWHRADYKSIGFYETDGGYTAWLNAPLNDRDDFCLATADERIVFPGQCDQGGLDFVFKGPSPFPSARGTYFHSMYMNGNYAEYANGDQSAPMPQMLYVTQQLIKAEGLARLGNLAAAAGIVDRTRVGRGNLPPASTTDLNTLLPQIWYEYLIENYYVCTGCAYFPRRGWQALSPTGPAHHWGLVEGTPLHFPPPGKELEILGLPNWTYGGVGNEGGTLQPVPASSVSQGSTWPVSAIYAFNDMVTTAEKLEHVRRERPTGSGGILSLVRH
ncbi:MAG: hypothetical protein JSW51_00715 [Gemmatimonadota bacterium]|nr:MAG: hypothetical protein JSW51_00715 [Gemmatimonadota bacterium]